MIPKKGVSPLIATVLLLAFAVSIATIIVQLEPFSTGCSEIDTSIMTLDNKPRICYDKNVPGIEVIIKNGKYDIIKTQASVVGEKNVKNTEIYKKIKKNTAEKIVIDYSQNENGNPQSIILTPTYNMSENVVECPLEIEIKGIDEC